MPSSRRPALSAALAEAIEDLHQLLVVHHSDLRPETVATLQAALAELRDEPPKVAVDVAAAIGRVDALLRAEWGYAFQYSIIVDGRTAAAANTEKCAAVEGHRIKPKQHRRH